MSNISLTIIYNHVISEMMDLIPHQPFGDETDKVAAFEKSFGPIIKMCVNEYFVSLVKHGKVIPDWGKALNLGALAWTWGLSPEDAKLVLASINSAITHSNLFDQPELFNIDNRKFLIQKNGFVLIAEEQ